MSRRPPASTPASATAVASPWRPQPDREQARRQDREAKRVAVLRTAAQVFNEKGFQAATLDEVAERLHVSKPTLYYYVKNKDEILFECVRIGLQLLQDAIAAAGAAGGSALDQLVAAMRAYADIVTQDFGMCIIRVGEDPLPEAGRVELRAMKARLDLEFRRLIEQAIAEGSIAPCDAKLAAFTIAGALSWIGRWYRPGGEWSPEQIAGQMIGLLQRGLCGAVSPPTDPARPTAASGPAGTRTPGRARGPRRSQ